MADHSAGLGVVEEGGELGELARRSPWETLWDDRTIPYPDYGSDELKHTQITVAGKRH